MASPPLRRTFKCALLCECFWCLPRNELVCLGQLTASNSYLDRGASWNLLHKPTDSGTKNTSLGRPKNISAPLRSLELAAGGTAPHIFHRTISVFNWHRI
jgi:hypothetical protein